MTIESQIDYYLTEISRRSNKFGDKLLECLDINNKSALKDLTLNEVKEYYESLVKIENS